MATTPEPESEGAIRMIAHCMIHQDANRRSRDVCGSCGYEITLHMMGQLYCTFCGRYPESVRRDAPALCEICHPAGDL